MRLALLLLTGLAAPLAAAPVPGEFRQINLDGGGWFTGFAAHPSGRLYGRTDVGGVYRSDDHGDSWQFLSGDFTSQAGHCVQGIVVGASDPQLAYLACGVSYAATDSARGVWRTTNGGVTWAQALSGVQFSGNDAERHGGECLALRPGNDAEVWAGSRGEGLFRSLNGGTNWTQVGAALFDTGNVNITSVLLHPVFTNQVWVAGAGGLWASTNSGVTWTNLHACERVNRVVRRTNGTAFFTGVNFGNTVLYRIDSTNWNVPATYTKTNLYPNWTSGLPWSPNGDFALITILADGSLVSGHFYNFTRRSFNNGTNWTTLPLTLGGPLPSWEVPGTANLPSLSNHLVQDPSLPSRWFAAGGFGPTRSTNAGSNWTYIVNGIGEVVTWRVTFDPADSNRVFIPMADLAGAVVTDGGDSGNAGASIHPFFPWPDDNILFTHRIFSTGTRWIGAGGEQSAGNIRLYYTDNQGALWRKFGLSGLPTNSGRSAVDCLPSRDNPQDFLVFLGGTTGAGLGGIYRTTNATGSNLVFTQSTGLPLGFAAGDLFYWQPRLDADATNQAVRYLMLRNSAFYRSTNRGASWATNGLTQPPGYSRMDVDDVTGRIWIAPEFNTGPWFSTNGGASWTALTNFSKTFEIDACAGRVAVLAQRPADAFPGVFYSADHGTNWSEITRPGYRIGNAQAVAVDPWRPGTVWISSNGRSVARFTPWSPVETWRHAWFGSPTNAGPAANPADPEGDGLPNLTEYALGTNPLLRNATNAPVPVWTTHAGARHLALSIPRNGLATGVTCIVEGSPDLLSWNSAGLVTLTNSASLLLVRDAVPATNAPARFLRLRVTEP